jgi:hypothetical protein
MNSVTGLDRLLLSPKEVIILVVNVEAPSRASSTDERNLGLCDTVLGSEVRGLKERVLRNSRNLVQLELCDLCGNEREKNEEGGKVLHGGNVSRVVSRRRTGGLESLAT